MNAEVEKTSGAGDTVLWILAVLLLIGAVVGNQYFATYPAVVRVIGILALTVIALFVASRTEKGRNFLLFAKESRIETRKVVWPTRQETVQTTMIVLFFVILLGLMLWGLDSILIWAMTFVTG